MNFSEVFGIFWILFCFGDHAFGKECTNIPTQLSSHTARYQLLSSKNETWKKEVFSHYHLNHEEESTWMDLLPRKFLKESNNEDFNWAMLYRGIKNSEGQGAGGGDFLKEVSLHDVRIDPDSVHGMAQQTNLEYLLMLDLDRLVWSFRKQAGLLAPGTPYGGWEGSDVELRGHFVGHYMSATAKMWASTHNDTLNEKMSAVIDVLYACQKKTGTGYLSAFPSEFFDRFEAIKSVWAPYYTIHKIMAGLLDQYLFAENKQALQMVEWMAEYFANRVKNVIINYSIERHWTSLNEETGGMNDVLYNLYSITGDQKHLILAHLFDKPCFLGLLAMQADGISGFHANTHIPVVIGAQRRYEITGDLLYKEIGTFFMDIVNSSHSYATGGTSVGEFWSDPKRLADTLKVENEESCTTYNMLKVSRNLFRWSKEMAYADYYERALTNGVLSIQRGREPGVMIYMLPQGRGVSKARSYHKWGTPFNSFWCCYGTGIESFSKLGDSIYFEEIGTTPSLYIIQYISNTLTWKTGGVVLGQKVDPVASSYPYLHVVLTIVSAESHAQSSTLNLRIPFWTALDGVKVALNGQSLDVPHPGNFLSITKTWAAGDKLDLEFPIGLRTEKIEDDRPQYASIKAILFGPYLLVGLSGGDWDIVTGNVHSMSEWISAIPSEYNSQLVSLAQGAGNDIYILTNSNNTAVMDRLPEPGTDASVHATFRLIFMNVSDSRSQSRSRFPSHRNIVGKPVILEPYDLPGGAVVHRGPQNSLAISYSTRDPNSIFYAVAGLNGKPNTISFLSGTDANCFVYSDTSSSAGKSVQIICAGEKSLQDSSFQQAVTFMLIKGFKEYNPISFIAKGAARNYILEPLMNIQDESYTAYFNITA